MSSTPIADHALLSDRHSARAGDRATGRSTGCASRASTARRSSAGCSTTRRATGRCRPAGEWTSSRRYLERTLVLETTFHTPAGTLVLTDALALGPDNGGHRLGADAPHLLVRRLTCTAGEVPRSRSSYQPRPEYGLITPDAVGGRRWGDRPRRRRVAGADDPRRARVSRAATRRGATHAAAPARPSTSRCIAPRWSRRRPGSGTRTELAERLDATRSTPGGRGRTCTRRTTGPWADLVHHSGRVLQGLSFQPSGAIVAAADDVAARGHRRASATGTTATPGCATPASPWRRCGSRPARTRPTTSSPS